MIVVYADGGGLGHLTRIQSVRHTLGWTELVTVLTASTYAGDERVTAGLRIVPIPVTRDDRDARRSWLQRTLAELDPSLLVVDAFPAGLGGEVDATTVAGSVPRVHLARLLRWDAYRRVLPAEPVRYDRTYLLEAVHAEHHRFLRAHAEAVVPLDLVDPPSAPRRGPGPAPVVEDLVGGPRPGARGDAGEDDDRPRWLVTHTGPAAEVLELVTYARDQADAEGESPWFVVVAPARAAPPAAPDLVHVDRYPVWPLFGSADRIVTAAGFNAMRQLAPPRDRHRFLPMPRRFDDQVERARRAHRAAADGASAATGAPSP